LVIEAVLFDMDGVIADSETGWNEIDGAMLAECGIAYRGELKEHVLGKSFPLALQFYKETFSLPQTIEALSERRTAIAADFYAHTIDIYPAVHSVLQFLRDENLRLAVATSSVGELIHPFLKRHDLTPYFDVIVTGEEVTRGKPFPDIYLRAAQKVGAAPEKCLVIEDALSGVQAGKSAGMTVVAIPDPRFMDVSLYPGKCDYILNHLGELPELVNELRKAM
jgi:HAD superfamily hydrolase (TIGR01509 family)